MYGAHDHLVVNYKAHPIAIECVYICAHMIETTEYSYRETRHSYMMTNGID
jgi:hypothetical protein